MPERKLIAITGTMGAGKSAAAKILKKTHPVLDLDEVNRRLLEPGQPGNRALTFDWISRDAAGNIDKPVMASAMFTDETKRKAVEGILHPLLWQAMEDWAGKQTGTCFVEVPLLFETGSQDRFDEIWCITCAPETALARLESGRNIPANVARARLAAQWSPEKKAEMSDVVLYNDGTLEDLERELCRQ